MRISTSSGGSSIRGSANRVRACGTIGRVGMDILDEMEWRGLVAQTTDRDALRRDLASGVLTLYSGFDPTAPSLHAGHLVPLLTLCRFQRAGHRPIVLAGGATGMIGDPREVGERTLNDLETVASWGERIRGQLERFVEFDRSPTGALVVNNLEWTGEQSVLSFLRDVGKHFPVNDMLSRETIKRRLAADGITYTEFSYQLLQSQDYLHLYRRHGCRLQVGGSDQWGNITAGVELQRKLGRAQIFGLTGPLLLDASGQKMGKTSAGQKVWLDGERTSPYALYQYWLNTDDESIERFLKIFSFRSLDEIDEIIAAQREAPHKRLAQKALAEEFTAWVHGKDAVRRALAASQVMFGGSLDDLRDADLKPLLSDVPSSTMARDALSAGIELAELLAQTGLAESKGAARRLIKGGGVYINNIRIADIGKTVTTEDLGTESMMVLRAGRKRYHIVSVT